MTRPEESLDPKKDRSHWPVHCFQTFDEVRAHRIKQWQKAGCEARMQAAWELMTDYWVGVKCMHPDELRLQKSVISVQFPDYLIPARSITNLPSHDG